MDKNNWKVDNDGVYMNSISKLYIPWLEKSFDVWVDLDNRHRWFTQNQKDDLEKFISISNKIDIRIELKNLYLKEIKNNTIERVEFAEILETINWNETKICIPKHAQSENRYVLFLLETKWKFIDNDYSLELELLFTNEKIELCQEMSGLWCRTEWFEYYLKRPKYNL